MLSVVLDFDHSSRCVITSHCYLFYISLMKYDEVHRFLFAICVAFFVHEMIFKVFELFFNQVVCFLLVQL